MRIMGVDYGDARTGIAVSDAGGMLVGRAWTLSEWNFEKAAAGVAEAARECGAERIVVGNPLNMNGSAGPRSEKCCEFAARVGELSGVEVVLWDERLTTVDAHRILSDNGRSGKKRRERVDAVAASLILEGYLGSL